MPIQNGSNKKLNQQTGNLPNVSAALGGWLQPTVFTLISVAVEGFQADETRTPINFMGVVQPLSGQRLEMKPEGERSWNWLWVHAQPAMILSTDEVIEYLGVKYRVMRQKDYTNYGYSEYELVQDYTGYPGSGD